MVKVLKEGEVKDQHPVLHKVFWGGERQEKEGLHDYLIRKGIGCFCPKCRQTKLI